MEEQIQIKIEDRIYKVTKGTTLEELLYLEQKKHRYPILIAKVNNSLKELNYKIMKDKKIEFYDLTESAGNRVHTSGLKFVLIVAIKELLGEDKNIRIEHSLDKGIYIEADFKVDEKTVKDIEEKMREIIQEDRPITKVTVEKEDAINYFKEMKDEAKVGVIKYNVNSYINLYKLGDYYNYFYNKMPISTRVLQAFELNYVDNRGFMLRFPTVYINDKIPEYTHHKNMFEVFNACRKWNALMNINNAPDLNKIVSNSNIEELIRISENKLNSEFLEIAKDIVKRKEAKIILMAGPSSSGKTTSSKKLCMALKTLGKMPYAISMDDYFVEREETPIGKDGKPDYESLEAIDLKLFDSQIASLLAKENVKIPTYNFITGKKEYKKYLQLNEQNILIIEGIHALDNRILKNIPKENKYKIYTSALTELNIDNHNRVSTTDNRLLRRIIRDNKTRGHNVEHTLAGWHSVRVGEENYIFPYQDEADYTLNTALLYEIGVLKTYVEPLLYSVEKESPYYAEAKRLIDFLRNFLPITADAIPQDSILREFIGGSCYTE
ncbi:MAG: nucleoside kinase [Bacilli bacterium]|nr:nucleoside kinase [Bacilli bacterium]